MRGNCKYEVEVMGYFGGVAVGHDEDPHHYQVFETASELDKFISELVDAREKAFGEQQSKTAFDVAVENGNDVNWDGP